MLRQKQDATHPNHQGTKRHRNINSDGNEMTSADLLSHVYNYSLFNNTVTGAGKMCLYVTIMS